MRVLVVEDHKRLAEAVAAGLRDEGMAVDVVLDGQDALDHVAMTRYDVLVLDRDLPGLHGDEVCKALAADRCPTRVLMLDGLFARLEASFTVQRNFVASAAHELRTPLTLDKTLLQVALRNPRSTAEQWRATGAELLESGLQQERTLEALLTLATSEAGIGQREPSDLAKVATACLESAVATAGRRGLHVETSLSPAPMLGDPGLITRLVANLADNAVRHSLPGGTVEVSTTQRDGQAVLTVANSGPVIPPGEIGRLMQPFQRLAIARSSDADGHGLGLPIVRAIASAHGATLTTRARPGGGLHVQVSFPASGAAITQREPQTAEAGAGIMGL